jgi:hypothetical protein
MRDLIITIVLEAIAAGVMLALLLAAIVVALEVLS